MTDNDPQWLSILDTARLLDISERSVYRRIKDGGFTTKKVGNKTFVLIDEKTVKDRQTTDLDSKVTIARLQAELDGAIRENNTLKDERDYLRQALIATMSKIPQIEATASESQPKWWQFWR